jgi:hypothetical protein
MLLFGSFPMSGVGQTPKRRPVDEPPWDRFLDKPWGRFIFPGCGQTLDMHVSHGPGTPGTDRFQEGS